jgi:MarR family transcriptional regulator, organic hydroperoxide resistance regulator
MEAGNCIFFMLAKGSQAGTKFLHSKVSRLNLTPVQALVIAFLFDQDQIMAGELGKKIELDSATLTGILDRLETAQLIARKGNPDDRRSVKIHLTKKGKEIGREAGKLIEKANEEFLSTFTKNERQTLLSLIEKLREQFSR